MEDYKEKLKSTLEDKETPLEVKNWIEKQFPELRESEDEKMKKAILSALRGGINTEKYLEKHGTNHAEVENWLEKQCEKHLFNFDEAEKEKNDFVSGQFIECRKSFNEFKEFESYWLEYVGDDTYVGRSDNVLNKKFHITPRQLFTLFTLQHCPKCDEEQNEENQDYKVVSKFKIGDWITNGDYTWRITGIGVLDYILESQDGKIIDDTISFVDGEFHLWSYIDAKDGDILADEEPFIFRG